MRLWTVRHSLEKQNLIAIEVDISVIIELAHWELNYCFYNHIDLAIDPHAIDLAGVHELYNSQL